MARSDRRVQYTKKVIQEAVLDLLKKKTIDEMSIKEICELADINRGTFYLHYSQPRDVLKEIEENFVKEHFQHFDNYWKNERDINDLTRVYRCIIENKELCSILMGENGDPQFARMLQEFAKTQIIDEWQKEFPTHTKEHLDFLYDFVITGSMSLLLRWIQDDRGICADAFAKRLERLGHYSLIAAGEF